MGEVGVPIVAMMILDELGSDANTTRYTHTYTEVTILDELYINIPIEWLSTG